MLPTIRSAFTVFEMTVRDLTRINHAFVVKVLRIPSCGMWSSAGLVRTDDSEECVALIFRAERIREARRSSETSVFARTTRRSFPVDGILHSHRRETSNLT
jgi:hypothetical protein